MKEVVLSVASNVASRRQMMADALDWLTGVLAPLRCSMLYTTKALHGDSYYLNAVVSGYCDMPFEELHAVLKQHEVDAGRTEEMRSRHFVPIDIDIVIYDGEILKPKDYGQEFFKKGWDELKNPRK
ncbi:MAG: 2-amino-4-hydroxy-6-hydroxymethyldihydropteridine diphosphokinase [Bacteroidales bacterium]|nr:2-amino-4-hydroxy-6-hydroxymethyldihydropteridine diphosphokinase [Bacteroidales bacterium]